MEINNDTIKKVFQSMEYGKNMQNAEKAMEWLKSKNNKFTIYDEKNTGEIIEIFNQISTEKMVICTVEKRNKAKISSVTTSNRIKIYSSLCKFSEEIIKNSETICQIEMLTRGMLVKDSMKQIKLMANYIKYYAADVFNIKPGLYLNTFDIELNSGIGLSLLGVVMGNSMANAIELLTLTCPPLLVPTLTYILELAEKAGYSDFGWNWEIKNAHQEVSYISCPNFRLKRFKTPMIIFDSSDLDAACDSVIEAAWGHKGTLPESVGTLIVQENVFDDFLKKLKKVIGNVKVGNAADNRADLANPDKSTTERFLREVDKAQKRGIEVFQADPSKKSFQPTLFIGAAVRSNPVLDDDAQLSCAVSVLSFRNIDEAVQLANNSKQGYAASVWTENIGLANELAEKLNVSNVWINGHGLFNADIPIYLRKSSGIGIIGEKGCGDLIRLQFENSINYNKKCEKLKPKFSKQQLRDILFEIICSIQDNKIGKISEEVKEKLTKLILECINDQGHEKSSKFILGYRVYFIEEPRGPISFVVLPTSIKTIKLIFQAILHYNTVTVYTCETNKLLEEIFKFFPSEVVNLQPLRNKPDNTYTYHKHSDWLNTKNVWTNVGSSSQYKM